MFKIHSRNYWYHLSTNSGNSDHLLAIVHLNAINPFGNWKVEKLLKIGPQITVGEKMSWKNHCAPKNKLISPDLNRTLDYKLHKSTLMPLYYELMVKKWLNVFRADNNLHEVNVWPNGYCSYLKKENLGIVIQSVICLLHSLLKLNFETFRIKKLTLQRKSLSFEGLVCIY